MTRVLSGVALAAAALAAMLFLPVLALRVLACVVALLAEREYLKIAGVAVPPGLAIIACWIASSGAPWMFAIIPVLLMAGTAFAVLSRGESIQSAAAAAFGVVYVGVPLGMLAAIQGRAGYAVTLFLIATVATSDTAQYYTGRAFGRRPLAPTISPKKTVEGAVGGIVIGTAFVAIVATAFFGQTPVPMAAFGAVAVVLGIGGDLFESRLKRVAGMKDSSDLIPGHGGVLDRIDALLFVTPWFYFLFPR